jgi:hypothetical protein
MHPSIDDSTLSSVLSFSFERERNLAMVNDNLTPAWEVVLRVDGADVATAVAFREAKDRFIILVGVQDSADILAYADLVREASFRMSVARNFRAVQDIRDAKLGGNEASLPF